MAHAYHDPLHCFQPRVPDPTKHQRSLPLGRGEGGSCWSMRWNSVMVGMEAKSAILPRQKGQMGEDKPRLHSWYAHP